MALTQILFIATVSTKLISLFLHVASHYCAITPALNKHRKTITRLFKIVSLADEVLSIIALLMID